MGMFFVGVILILAGVGVILTGSIGGKMPGVFIDIGDAKYMVGTINIFIGIYMVIQWARDWLSKR
jgi:hypothetical protein